jgi:hypothetical protein
MKGKIEFVLLLKKADTSWDPACGNKSCRSKSPSLQSIRLNTTTSTSCGKKPFEGACSERSCCFKAKGVDTKSETSHTANTILRKVKGHVPVRRMGNQSSLCRQCAPLVISQRFAVAPSRLGF